MVVGPVCASPYARATVPPGVVESLSEQRHHCEFLARAGIVQKSHLLRRVVHSRAVVRDDLRVEVARRHLPAELVRLRQRSERRQILELLEPRAPRRIAGRLETLRRPPALEIDVSMHPAVERRVLGRSEGESDMTIVPRHLERELRN